MRSAATEFVQINQLKCSMHHKICSVSFLLSLLLVSNAAHAAITVNSTTIDYTSNLITIKGSSFSPGGGTPTVTLNGVTFALVWFTNTTILATLPSGTAAGSYRLRITNGGGEFYEFDVTYGAVGPHYSLWL